jgi:hypothetical protein
VYRNRGLPRQDNNNSNRLPHGREFNGGANNTNAPKTAAPIFRTTTLARYVLIPLRCVLKCLLSSPVKVVLALALAAAILAGQSGVLFLNQQLCVCDGWKFDVEVSNDLTQ